MVVSLICLVVSSFLIFILVDVLIEPSISFHLCLQWSWIHWRNKDAPIDNWTYLCWVSDETVTVARRFGEALWNTTGHLAPKRTIRRYHQPLDRLYCSFVSKNTSLMSHRRDHHRSFPLLLSVSLCRCLPVIQREGSILYHSRMSCVARHKRRFDIFSKDYDQTVNKSIVSTVEQGRRVMNHLPVTHLLFCLRLSAIQRGEVIAVGLSCTRQWHRRFNETFKWFPIEGVNRSGMVLDASNRLLATKRTYLRMSSHVAERWINGGPISLLKWLFYLSMFGWKKKKTSSSRVE